MIADLVMSVKLAKSSLLKIKVFWKNGHDFINCVHDVTYKILSGDSNYAVVMVMWPQFANSSIPMSIKL